MPQGRHYIKPKRDKSSQVRFLKQVLVGTSSYTKNTQKMASAVEPKWDLNLGQFVASKGVNVANILAARHLQKVKTPTNKTVAQQKAALSSKYNVIPDTKLLRADLFTMLNLAEKPCEKLLQLAVQFLLTEFPSLCEKQFDRCTCTALVSSTHTTHTQTRTRTHTHKHTHPHKHTNTHTHTHTHTKESESTT